MFECVSMRELVCDVVWFVCLLCACVCVCLCFIFDVSYLVMMCGIRCVVRDCVCAPFVFVWFACDLLCDVVGMCVLV